MAGMIGPFPSPLPGAIREASWLGPCRCGRRRDGLRSGTEGLSYQPSSTPTAWSTPGEKVANETVDEGWSPCFDLCEPGPAWKTTSRERRLLTEPVVSDERIGRPIVTQRTATSGSAITTGRARERLRASLRAEGSCLGSST